jgi:hypothetical protein
MHAQITQMHPLVQVQRRRILPVSGTVLVRAGQKVSTTEIIAETEIPARHHFVDVVRSFGLENTAQAEKLINRKPGDLVDKNDIIAETGGVFSKVIRIPVAGKVVSVKNGQVLVETGKTKVSVQAGFSGLVTELIKDRGAVIQTNGLLIQGVWGNNAIGFGPLQVDPEGIEKELTSVSLGITARGVVICASHCANPDVLQLAASLPVGGLILGSINPDLISLAEKQPFPILALEGFGKIGINEFARKLLVTNASREVSINAVKWNKWTGERPELIISLPAEGDPYRESVELNPGHTIRVHSAPYAGRLGIVQASINGLSTLPNGLRTIAAAVKFSNNEKAIIPVANLEIIDLDNRYLGKTE